MEMLMFISMSSGSLLSSYVYAATNAAITQGISASCVTLVTVFIIFYLPESLHIQKENNDKNATDSSDKDLPITAFDMQITSVSVDCPENLTVKEKNEKHESNESLEKKELNAKNEKNEINKKLANKLPSSESQLDQQKEVKPEDIELQKTNAETEPEKTGLFSPKHLKDMLVTFCKPREYHAREIIWLITLTMFLTMFVVGKLLHKLLAPYQSYNIYHFRWYHDSHVSVCAPTVPLVRAGVYFFRDSQPISANVGGNDRISNITQGIRIYF